MEFSIKTNALERLKTGCVVIAVSGGTQLNASGKRIDRLLGGRVSRILKAGDLPSKAGATYLLSTGKAIARVLLVSLGDSATPSDRGFISAARAASGHLSQLNIAQCTSLLHEVDVAGRSLAWKLSAQVIAARDAGYRFDQLKSKKESAAPGCGTLSFLVAQSDAAAASAEMARAVALADGMDLTKDLGNLAPNLCTPTYLADAAKALGRSHKLKVEVLDQKQIEALKMGAFLAVAQGSEQAPKFIVMHYQGADANDAPIVLVGKGITFDTGGISLKPAPDMDEMKYDMCGAASVLGTMRAIAQIKPKINLIGVIPTCENMPSGRATRPGDVVTSMSGQTIEILNTDAEGRLILCDALTYVERFKPAAVVDIATLTGACVIALGNHHSGLFSKKDELANALLQASVSSNEPCWRMPLDEEYQEGLKSNFADMANVGGRAGGAITAACFLARYTKAYNWAHLDIAGTAWKSGASKGASGRPVPLLTRFVLDCAGQ
jgi:leucyl aminopeptidase